ncbi:unnamed protein product [Spirodela intermedia]|uniref:Uncharacterized protein n=2 Tax=Spirodela intermedia TaxID=51605 RepID=A0A7I8L5F2_SPIIN|nr:unnamed protein product [Spirodela intermedia]CAA6668396.1 unnamed protein product [Spirodela intermedia]CAA7405243.1 unnamed protein product [Spirodela intermedia]
MRRAFYFRKWMAIQDLLRTLPYHSTDSHYFANISSFT